MKYLLTHDSDAERFSDWLSGVKYLLTHDSDAERFSDWLLDEVSTHTTVTLRDLVIGCLDEVSTHT